MHCAPLSLRWAYGYERFECKWRKCKLYKIECTCLVYQASCEYITAGGSKATRITDIACHECSWLFPLRIKGKLASFSINHSNFQPIRKKSTGYLEIWFIRDGLSKHNHLACAVWHVYIRQCNSETKTPKFLENFGLSLKLAVKFQKRFRWRFSFSIIYPATEY